MFADRLTAAAADLLNVMREAKLKLATAESCTGGLVAALLTEIPGSSDVLDRGFVTYSNDAKTVMLGVPAEIIAEHGAVSREVAVAMAQGAIARSLADVTAAITGVAGPGGGSAAKPVGLVHLAVATRKTGTLHRECRFGDIGRSAIRLASVEEALKLIREMITPLIKPE